ncbi:MAG TPA: response regulator [Methanobacterium sp.]|nr:response regulator [Methanobacterium sp.]
MYNTRILIIEDEAVIAMNLQDRFEFWGYSTPMIVSSQEEALKMANEEKPDLVLINIDLKNDNSIELAKKITDNLDTALIFITSSLNEEIMQLMRVTRYYGHIALPFEENQIKYTVENALYRRRINQRFILSK